MSVKSELEKSEILNRQVRNKVNITNDDVERYYKLNANKFRSEDRVRLRHILLALPKTATPDEVQAVTEKAMDLYQRIVAGADFAELAREYSEGAGQAEGGDIGWVNRGTLIGIKRLPEDSSDARLADVMRVGPERCVLTPPSRRSRASWPTSTCSPRPSSTRKGR